MAKLIIQGGKKLSGDITAYANKNAVLPILVATLLTDKPCIIKNVPEIRDVESLTQILEHVGANVRFLDQTTLEVTAPHITNTEIPDDLARKIRASVLLQGGLLGRAQKVSMIHPGGDVIGRRSIETHIMAFKQLGVIVNQNDDRYSLTADNLAAAEIFLDEASVTATENILLLAATLKGKTTIKNAASEPHVGELCQVLQQMGVAIDGVGTNVLVVGGQSTLSGFEHRVGSDHIEAGTWAVLAGVTGGKITIHQVNPESLDIILLTLKRFGLHLDLIEEHTIGPDRFSLTVFGEKLVSPRKIDANIWPGFPTDLISVAIVLATQARGTTLVRDFMYEGRMFFTDKLIRMGADIILSDPHRVVVTGPTQLVGRELDSPDLRAGMALVVAALAAQGESVISHIEHIERGYADMVPRLRALGADIMEVED